MNIEFIRHATLIVEIGASKYLVDPMFSAAEAWDPVSNSANPRRNPMVDLPLEQDELEDRLDELEAVFVTHIHADHWDDPAKEMIHKDLPIFCQPNDPESITEAGFNNVTPVENAVEWEGINISLTGGQHGTAEVAARIGPVSGFVIKSSQDPSLYIAGDTIWCPEVKSAIATHQPDVIVVNAGAAQFIDSDPITMDIEDVLKVAYAASDSQVVAVHMETINHCVRSRAELMHAMEEAGLADRVSIPADGEVLTY